MTAPANLLWIQDTPLCAPGWCTCGQQGSHSSPQTPLFSCLCGWPWLPKPAHQPLSFAGQVPLPATTPPPSCTALYPFKSQIRTWHGTGWDPTAHCSPSSPNAPSSAHIPLFAPIPSPCPCSPPLSPLGLAPSRFPLPSFLGPPVRGVRLSLGRDRGSSSSPLSSPSPFSLPPPASTPQSSPAHSPSPSPAAPLFLPHLFVSAENRLLGTVPTLQCLW